MFKVFEHDGLAPVLHQMRRGGRRFEHGAAWRQIAAQHADAAIGQQRVVQGAHDFVVVDRRFDTVVPDRLAVDGQRILMRQQVAFAQAAYDGRQAARIVKLFHQEAARRQQVDDGRRAAARLRPVFQFQRHADASGNGFQVDHGIGRAADGGVDLDGVLECFARQHFRQAQVFMHHFNDADARHVRQHVAARIDGRDGRVVRQGRTQRFGHAGHRRGRTHGVAGACRARHARFGRHELVQGDRTGLHLLVQLPHGRAGTDVLAVQLAIEHGAAADDDGGNVDAGRAHQQGRRRLVAADQQHDGVHRIAADRFFHVHRRQVARQHGRRAQVRFAVREHGEFHRETTGFQDAALDVFGQLAEMRIARGQLGPGIADANDGLAMKLVVRYALVFHPAAVHEAVLVLRAEPLGRAQGHLLFCLRHAILLVVPCRI